MDVMQLVEIALANVDRHRVEVTALEAADVAIEAVGGMTQLLTELIDNAIAFSAPSEKVGITGVFDQGEYVVSISDNGVGIPETLLSALNRVLGDPENTQTGAATSLGIAVVARTAARHGIDVRLIPAVPGTTARITIPSNLVSTPDAPPDVASDESPAEFAVEEAGYHPGHVVAMTESARREAEAFLEKVFGPLRGRTASRRPAKSRPNGGNGQTEPSSRGSQDAASVGEDVGEGLETRVPGVNFSVSDDDPSVMSGEGAIDIMINLSRYDKGRKQAAEGDVGGPPGHD